MKINDLVNLIAIRDFSHRNFDNVYFKMSNEEVKQLGAKLTLMDKCILAEVLALKLDVPAPQESPKKKNEDTK